MSDFDVLKGLARMCGKIVCYDCQLFKDGDCKEFMEHNSAEAAELIEQWVKENQKADVKMIEQWADGKSLVEILDAIQMLESKTVKVGENINNNLVRIVDVKKQYSSYGYFIEDVAPTYFHYYQQGKLISREEREHAVFRVVAKRNVNSKRGIILVIQNVRTKVVYVIGEDGVECIEDIYYQGDNGE